MDEETYSLSCRLVIIQPGEIVFTRIRRGPSSRANERVKPIVADLVAT